MITNKYGEMIFNEDDVCDLLMSGRSTESLKNMLVDNTVSIEKAVTLLEQFPQWIPYTFVKDNEESVADWDYAKQQQWAMPEEYKHMDIAKYVLDLCENEAELQRVGAELLLYQEKDLFNLLRYLKYLVDIMTQHKVIWGVGRGSSVASYVLYKLKVHKIDSLFYKLDIKEFLR